MIVPSNCPYYGKLTSLPCRSYCSHYNPDTDECMLNVNFSSKQQAVNAIYGKNSIERLQGHESTRNELLQLSKEALVDLILHKPTF